MQMARMLLLQSVTVRHGDKNELTIWTGLSEKASPSVTSVK